MRDLVLLATTVLLAIATGGNAQVHKKVLVTGRAVDEDGKPLAAVGTALCLTQTLRTVSALEAAKPVADGRFRVELPLPGNQAHRARQGILIAAKGRQSLFLYYYARPLASQPAEPVVNLGDVALLRGTTLSGQVRDAAGEPLAGVRVTSGDLISAYMRLESGANLSHRGAAMTNARGMFRLPGAPKNAVKLVFWKDGYYQQVLQPVSQGTPINVRMQAGGFVEGQAVDASGKGVPATLTFRYEAGSGASSAVYTAADGRFKANLAYPGRYRLQQYARPDLGHQRLLSPILGGPQRNVLVRPPGSGAGSAGEGGCFLRFAAADKKSGKAIPDLDVAFYTGHGSVRPGLLLLHNPQHRMKTDDRGNVHVPSTLSNRGQAVVLAKGHAPARSALEGTGTRDKPEIIKVEMVPESVVEGRVVDQFDKPMASVKVWTVWLEGKMSVTYGHVPPGAVETDKAGKFRLSRLGSGTHTVQAFVRGQPPASANLELDVGETKSDITLQIPPGFKIAGTLKGVKTGRGWEVQLQLGPQSSPSGTAKFSGANRYPPQTVGADGKFHFQSLELGTSYTLSLCQPFHDRFRQPLRFELATIPAIAADKSFEFQASNFETGRIHGTVKVSGAKGLAERLVVLAVANVDHEKGHMRFQKVREHSRAALVDLVGRFDLRVTPGRYDIRAFDIHTCVEVFKLDETLEVAGGAELQKALTIEVHPVRLKLRPVGDQRMALVDRLRIERKDRERRRGGIFYNPRYYLRVLSVHSGMPLRPGQSDVEFYAPPGEYQVQVMDRSVYLRDAQSFRHTPLGKQDIEVKEGKENEFTIEVEAAPSTKELEGKVAGDR